MYGQQPFLDIQWVDSLMPSWLIDVFILEILQRDILGVSCSAAKSLKGQTFFFFFRWELLVSLWNKNPFASSMGVTVFHISLTNPHAEFSLGVDWDSKKILLHCVGEMVGDEQQPASNGVIIVSSQWLFIPSQITFTKLRNYGWVWAWWCLHKSLP